MKNTFSPDRYEVELEQMEKRVGFPIEQWDEDDFIEFVKLVTGDIPTSIEFNEQFFLIDYTY